MRIKLTVGILLLLSTVHTIAENNSNISIDELLVISEMAGSCIILDSQIGFQQKAQLPGGGIFIEKFWDSEADKRKQTRTQFLEECTKIMRIYFQLHSTKKEPIK